MDLKKTARLAQTIQAGLGEPTDTGSSSGEEVGSGSVLGDRYEVVEKIGEGGMGLVFKGFDRQLNTPIAIKLMKKSMSQNRDSVERLKQEAQVAMMLTHPNIMRLINFEDDGKNVYLLMEYVDGNTLDGLAEKTENGRLSPDYVARIGLQVCQALEYAHQKNIIHRDIKPSNIMVCGSQSVRLMDLGIAKALVEKDADHDSIAGTLAYIAPEVFEGARPDARVDIYALGLTLYELMTGNHPFGGNTAKDIINHHFQTKPATLTFVSRELMKIIFQCLEKKPNARYQSAKELGAAFSRYLGLDEADQLKRMKSKMEYDKRRLAREKQDLERERYADQRDYAQSNLKQPSGAINIDGTQDISHDPFVMSVIALITGAIAAYAKIQLESDAFGEFGSDETYALVSTIVSIVLALGVPAYFRYGYKTAGVCAFIGFALGFIVFAISGSFQAHAVEQDMWNLYFTILYLAVGIPVALVAGFTHSVFRVWKGFLRNMLYPLVAIVATSLVVYNNIADSVFSMDQPDYLHLPLITLAVWGAIDFGERAATEE